MLLATIQRITTDYILAPMLMLALATIVVLIVRHMRM